MRKGDSNNSIIYLKQKFDEIRKNISNIEQRQKEFFVHSKPSDTHDLMKSISFREYTTDNQSTFTSSRENTHKQHNPRPSSVGRLQDTNRDKETFNPIQIIKTLETDKQELLLKLTKITLLKDELIKENLHLKNSKTNQLQQIENLREENDRLRRELNSNVFSSSLSFRDLSRLDFSQDKFYSTQSFPSPKYEAKPSIIKSDNSSPKKNRVAFSRDLVQVKHISDDDYKSHKPKYRSPSPIRSSVTDLSPHRLASSINFSYSNRMAQDTQTYHKQDRPNSSLGLRKETRQDDSLRRSEWKVTRPNISNMSSFEKKVYY